MMQIFLLRFWLIALVTSAIGADEPNLSPEIFAPEIISTDLDESCGSFSPDGQTFYFVRRGAYTTSPPISLICFSELRGGKWTHPEVAPFSELISMRRPASRRTANGYSFRPSGRRNRTRMAEIGTFGLSTRSPITEANRRNSASRSTRPRTIETRQSQRMEQFILRPIATVLPGISTFTARI
jgi:hypothetical protein